MSAPNPVSVSLAHRTDVSLLKESFRQVRKSGADEVTAKEYAENLDANLCNLYQRLRRGQYVAAPVKRIRVTKENGKMRPIGIPALEDKIAQKAVEAILCVIYDADFHDFSHGFRKGHSQHKALQALREQCRKLNISRISDADISGFFDNTDHQLLKDVIKQRVNDGRILNLTGKWLNAGVMEEGNLTFPEKGTPQGGVISPMLSDIFLHTALDDRFVKVVSPRMKGRCFISRWADDFITGFEVESDARRVTESLPKRFGRYGLLLNTEKTKLIPFMKPNKSGKFEPGTSDFLGFTFYWGKSLSGKWVLKKQTAKKRLIRFMKSLWKWCGEQRRKPLKEQYEMLYAKLRGYYQYFGVRGNYGALKAVFEHARRAWRYWLCRRNHKGSKSWEKFEKISRIFPLPKPGIIRNI